MLPVVRRHRQTELVGQSDRTHDQPGVERTADKSQRRGHVIECPYHTHLPRRLVATPVEVILRLCGPQRSTAGPVCRRYHDRTARRVVRVRAVFASAPPRPRAGREGPTMPARIDMAKFAKFCKDNGFIFQSSEIYGGLNGFWDYGPLGVELKRNVKEAWWLDMVRNPPPGPDGKEIRMVGLDCSIIMNPKVWVASGHVGGFSDPMVDCKTCKARFRADQIAGAACPRKPSKAPGQFEECQLTEPRAFNLMFQTYVGAVQDADSVAYLRPETAQGIFANFKNVLDSTRLKLPFGIAQVGKAFRNEINPRNFTFR